MHLRRLAVITAALILLPTGMAEASPDLPPSVGVTAPAADAEQNAVTPSPAAGEARYIVQYDKGADASGQTASLQARASAWAGRSRTRSKAPS